MALISRITAARTTGYTARPGSVAPFWEEAAPADLYGLLKSYYHQVDLYADINRALYNRGVWREGMVGLRNPANRVVEFYASHLWPGPLEDALRIDGATEPVAEAIQQVWTWSNWGARKQLAARTLAMLGDLFIKVATTPDSSRVYFQLLEPEQVTDFDTDERGFIVYIRVDVPRSERGPDGKTRRVTHTEVWSKSDQTYTLWVHTRAAGEELTRLGTAREVKAFTEFGFDFVPFVHAMFRDVGQARGQAPITPALDKIDEGNRIATRLHQLLFRHNNNTWALRANGLDATGRPLPPPRLDGDAVSRGESTDTVTLADEVMVRLPGTSELQSLVPNINYAAALDILNAHLLELRRDLPELVYDELPAMADASGVAVRLRMSGAVDRVLEARGNALSALVRADEMALTIGAGAGLFTDIGTYEAGDFTHDLAPPPVVPLSEQEEDATRVVRGQIAAGLADVLAPRDRLALVFPEWDAEQLDKAIRDMDAQTPAGLGAIDREFGRLARVRLDDAEA